MIPWLSSMALCAFLHPRFRWWTVLGAFLIALLLFSHHNVLVNHEGLIGRWSMRQRFEEAKVATGRESVLQVVRSLARKDSAVYPAGWLDEAAFLKSRGRKVWDPGAFDLCRIEIRPLWHSFVTGIYRCDQIPLRPWYPGGPLAEGTDHIEFREQS